MLMASGCGSVAETGGEAEIELKEPVAVFAQSVTEEVIKRDLYVTDVYEAFVYPEVTEYSYETSQKYDYYGKRLGDEVSVGDVLLYADEESIVSRIEKFKEKLDKLVEDYEEYCAVTNEKLAEYRTYMENYAEIVEEMMEEDENNPQLGKWEGQYNLYELRVNSTEEKLRQKRELYELDYAYYSGQLQDLLAQQRATKLVSDTSGMVVGISIMSPETNIQQETSVIAVGNPDEKYIKCEYINRRDILFYSKDVYAFVNGKRYEVTYVDDGNKECTTFLLHDEKEEVAVGDYATVVLIKQGSREQVLAVANEAIHTDATERYVYVIENGEPVMTPVKTGISDGFYTEILSGLEEGDLVQQQTTSEMGDNTCVLEKSVFDSSFSSSGVLYYPEGEYVKNTVENGTVYFVDYLVDTYQYVNAGDPIASIRVEGDRIEVTQMEMDLKRDKERLADLIAEDNEANAETIEQRKESIAEQEEKLAQLQKDYATTTIYTPVSGYVEGLKKYSEDAEIKKDAILALISNVEVGYLSFKDALGILSYGDVLDVSFTDRSGKIYQFQGTVANLNNLGLSSSLKQENILLKLPDDVIPQLLESMKNQPMRYTYSKLLVSGTVREMKDVLLVPIDAVTKKDGVTYVDVLLDDGTVVSRSFIAGGSDPNYYWVIDGLTEGMKLCWE